VAAAAGVARLAKLEELTAEGRANPGDITEAQIAAAIECTRPPSVVSLSAFCRYVCVLADAGMAVVCHRLMKAGVILALVEALRRWPSNQEAVASTCGALWALLYFSTDVAPGCRPRRSELPFSEHAVHASMQKVPGIEDTLRGVARSGVDDGGYAERVLQLLF
jgi:hypothetical protein